MKYVGIDNGLNGGIVLLSDDGIVIDTFNMPVLKMEKTEYDIKGIVTILKGISNSYEYGTVKVYLEKAHVRPVQGIRAAFTTGYGLGIMQGILTSLGLSYEVVNPTVWMKDVFEGNYSKENKKYSMIFAQRKWPDTEWHRGKKIHDGLTDAACIGYYGYLKNKGAKE